ncbi:MAG: hypothetical protein ACJ735_11325 [Actinomycetes bacterium]
MTDANDLWGGTVTDLRADLTARTVTASVSVNSQGRERNYAVVLSGVSDLRVERPDAQWEYTEMTELHADPVDGTTRVEMVFWNEPNGLTATCANIVISETTNP